MRDLEQIIVANRKQQLDHFRARFQKARLLLPTGFTMDKYGNVVNRNFGYVVAIRSFDSLEDLISAKWYVDRVIEPRSVTTIVRDVEEIDFYFGYWKDTAGKEYFEVSRIYKSLRVAMKVARVLKQVAIYDFSTKDCIQTFFNELSIEDWRCQVSNGDTVLGFEEWKEHQRIAKQLDETIEDRVNAKIGQVADHLESRSFGGSIVVHDSCGNEIGRRGPAY